MYLISYSYFKILVNSVHLYCTMYIYNNFLSFNEPDEVERRKFVPFILSQ